MSPKEPPGTKTPPVKGTPAQGRLGGVGSLAELTLRHPVLWVLALILTLGEASCSAFTPRRASDVAPTETGSNPVTVVRAVDGSPIIVRNPTLRLASALMDSAEEPEAADGGARIVGGALGAWLSAIPVGLLMVVVLGAYLRPGYYRRQRALLMGRPSTEPLFRPGTPAFRATFVAMLGSTMASGTAAVLGALPGTAILLAGDAAGSKGLVATGPLLILAGSFGAYLYVRLGMLFAERWAVLSGLDGRSALVQAWNRAQGRRRHYLVWWLLATAVEAVGALGWFIIPLGAISHSAMRAGADLGLTAVFLRHVEPTPRRPARSA